MSAPSVDDLRQERDDLQDRLDRAQALIRTMHREAIDRERELHRVREAEAGGGGVDRQALASTILDSFATHDGKTWLELAEHAADAVIRSGEGL